MRIRHDLPGLLSRPGRGLLRLIGFRSRMLPGGVHVMERAGTAPDAVPILCVHGIGADLTNWGPMVAFLGRRHTLRLLDLPGHGASEDVEPVTLEALNAALVSAVDALPPGVIVGNSLGGAVALHLTVQRPERVRGLYLISPAGPPMPEPEFRAVVGQFDMTSWAQGTDFYYRLMGRRAWSAPLIVPVILRIFARPFLHRLRASFRAEGALDAAQARGIAVPVTLRWGARDGVLPSSLRDWLLAHVPGIEREDPPDEGHSPQVDRPHRVAARVRAFLQRVA